MVNGMSRVVLRLILDVVLTIVVAFLLLAGWQSVLAGSAAEGFPEAFRVLFNFMDVGLALWVVMLIVAATRGKGAGPRAGRTFLLLVIGAVVNLLVVITVGFIQGGWAPLLVVFAVEAGICCLVAGAIAVALIHRFVQPVETQLGALLGK
jgi:hypothetical protein